MIKTKAINIEILFKKKGIVFTANNVEQFAEQVYTIFLGADEISDIRDMMSNENNYEKSMIVNVILKPETEDNIIDVLMDEMNKQKSIKTNDYQLEQPVKTSDGAYIQLCYTRKLPGRNKLLEYEKDILE